MGQANAKPGGRTTERRGGRAVRRVLGWALVVLAVGVAGLAAWSRGRDWTFHADGHGCQVTVAVSSGLVQVQMIRGLWHDPLVVYPTVSASPTGPWVTRVSSFPVQPEFWWWGWRWFRSVQAAGTNTFVAMPLWVIGAALGACGALLVRSARFRRAGTCARCGYDLRGLGKEGVCPECGAGNAAENCG